MAAFQPVKASWVSPEVRDIYRDISLAINIAGFEAYRCISDVYRGALSEAYRWCCIDSKFFGWIIVDVVL